MARCIHGVDLQIFVCRDCMALSNALKALAACEMERHCRQCDSPIGPCGLPVMGFCSTSCKNIYITGSASQ